VEYPALDRIENLVSNIDTWQRQMADRIAEMDQQGIEGKGDSGMITATSASDGRITAIAIDPRAMRLGSQDLAADLLQAVQRAQQAAGEKIRDVVKGVMGEIPR
jgi:DNA-binding protein YbaB